MSIPIDIRNWHEQVLLFLENFIPIKDLNSIIVKYAAPDLWLMISLFRRPSRITLMPFIRHEGEFLRMNEWIPWDSSQDLYVWVKEKETRSSYIVGKYKRDHWATAREKTFEIGGVDLENAFTFCRGKRRKCEREHYLLYEPDFYFSIFKSNGLTFVLLNELYL